MNGKGFFGFFGGMLFGVIVFVILILVAAYVFGPGLIPETPCVLDTNCDVQKVCCTWRCDSKDFTFWKCPDQLCRLIGAEEPTEKCKCLDFNCGFE